MERELFRLASYSTSPAAFDVSISSLSRHGFYYKGMSDTVECFACKTPFTGWSGIENLQEMHKQKAPRCQLLNGNTSTLISDSMRRIYTEAYKRTSSKGVFWSNSDYEIDRLKPDYEKLRNEQVRLRTFLDWPLGAQADSQVLASDGLFYTGTEDRVQCVFCRGFMRNWEPTDIPSAEHKKHFPDCHFVRGLDVGNVPIARVPKDAVRKTEDDAVCKAVIVDDCQRQRILQERLRGENMRESNLTSAREQFRLLTPTTLTDPPKFPEYADASKRISSFQRGQVSRGHTAEGLADAGWFWIGPGDKVQCFQCGGNLRDWEQEDDSWEEHKRWYTDCPYLKTHYPTPRRQLQEPAHLTLAHKSGQYCVEPRKVKARMNTAIVRAILNMGYSKDLVRMAIEKRLSTTGHDFPNAESLLESLFQLEEERSPLNGVAGSELSAIAVTAANDNAAYRSANSKMTPGGYSHVPQTIEMQVEFLELQQKSLKRDQKYLEWQQKFRERQQKNLERELKFFERDHKFLEWQQNFLEREQKFLEQEQELLEWHVKLERQLTNLETGFTEHDANKVKSEQSHGQPVGNLEENGETLCGRPGTHLDYVTAENVFPSGEPGFVFDSDSMTLDEKTVRNICSICLDSDSNCAFCPCGHYACLSCIDQWSSVHPANLTCHICRQEVKELFPF